MDIPNREPLKWKETPKLWHVVVSPDPNKAAQCCSGAREMLLLGARGGGDGGMGPGSGCLLEHDKNQRPRPRHPWGCRLDWHVGSYLGEVEPIERMALLLHPLHSPSTLLHLLSLLSQVEVQHGHTSGAHICLRERVHHEHHPHWPLALPVASNGIEQVVSVQPLASLRWCHPRGHHQLHIVQVALQAPVELPWQHVLQVLPVGQQLAAGQCGDGVGICQIQLEVDTGAGLEGRFGIIRDEVPDPGVGNVDGAKQVGRGMAPNSPQEGVQVPLLQEERRGEADQ